MTYIRNSDIRYQEYGDFTCQKCTENRKIVSGTYRNGFVTFNTVFKQSVLENTIILTDGTSKRFSKLFSVCPRYQSRHEVRHSSRK